MPVTEFGSSRNVSEWRESQAARQSREADEGQPVITAFQREATGEENPSPLSVIVCTYERPQRVSGFLTSFFNESYHPHHLIIVDASPGDETERVVVGFPYTDPLDVRISYFRVTGPLKGLTSQRNFGLRHTETSHVVYFDDDVVLTPECLMEMEKAFQSDPAIVGVAGYNDAYRPSKRLWKIRKALRIVSDLRPGSYQRSGMAVPWSFMSPSETLVSDWLPGCGMMWKTSVIREAGGFNEEFRHYALGEDIDMSLRAGKKGKLLVVGAAKFKHLLDEGGGRPNDFKKGYMEIHNRFEIQRRGLADRTWKDVLLFTYAWSVDTLMLLRNLFYPPHTLPVLRQIGGRILGALDLLRGK